MSMGDKNKTPFTGPTKVKLDIVERDSGCLLSIVMTKGLERDQAQAKC